MRQALTVIKEQTKEKQIFEGICYSEDLMIRSIKESQKNVIPYLTLMVPIVEKYDLVDLAMKNSF